ncbi:MAG: glycosyltransferase, partial [Deltaproteobacteria bacterium]|nr:glycosyltransferase [Deltaproteobacteria bacterium]
MRVLHVDSATEWRGGQAQLAHLLAGRPGDLLAAVPGGLLAARARAPDVPLHPGNDPRNALILRAAVSRLGIDLVAAHHSHAHDVSLLVPVPLVVHRRNHRPPGNAWKYRRAARVIAVSEFVAGLCRDAGIDRVTVVYDGVPSLLPAEGPLPASSHPPPLAGEGLGEGALGLAA